VAVGTDVVIVGGGVIGCACAAELSRRGRSVLLVERAELAAGASGRNHGLVLSPSEPDLVPMAKASLQVYREVAEGAAMDFRLDREPLGYLIVAGNDRAERDQAREEARAAEACGVAVEPVEGSRLHDLEPGLAPDLAEGWLLLDGRRLDPAALTVSLALAAAERGADIRHHVGARALLRRGEAVRGVVTDDGPIEAQVVVVAAGPWSSDLLRPAGVGLPVVAARGWLVHLRPPQPVLSRIVERAGWHLLPGEEVPPPITASDVAEGAVEPEVGTLLHPTPDGGVLAGGSRQFPAVHEPEDHGVPREIVRRAIRVLPPLAEARVLQAGWGLRPMSPDGRPIVGWVGDGLAVATGHGSQGVILAGGTAALLASLVEGEDPPFEPEPFRPDRFAADA
jgi:glycine/D-amino acid oxidase-like deaminating enzyme